MWIEPNHTNYRCIYHHKIRCVNALRRNGVRTYSICIISLNDISNIIHINNSALSKRIYCTSKINLYSSNIGRHSNAFKLFLNNRGTRIPPCIAMATITSVYDALNKSLFLGKAKFNRNKASNLKSFLYDNLPPEIQSTFLCNNKNLHKCKHSKRYIALHARHSNKYLSLMGKYGEVMKDNKALKDQLNKANKKPKKLTKWERFKALFTGGNK